MNNLQKSLIGRRAYHIISLINILEEFDYISAQALATKLQVSRKSISRYISALKEHGYEIKDIRKDNRSKSVYRMVVDKIEEKDILG